MAELSILNSAGLLRIRNLAVGGKFYFRLFANNFGGIMHLKYVSRNQDHLITTNVIIPPVSGIGKSQLNHQANEQIRDRPIQKI